MNSAARFAVLAVLVAASVAGYFWWYGPERQIRRTLDSVAEGFTHTAPASGLGAASAAASLQQLFSPDVVIEPGRPFGVVKGRDAVLVAAARLHATAPALRVEFVDVRIELAADDQSADVTCTAMATLRDRAGQETVDAREVIITLHAVDGRWVITRARALEVLEPVTP